VTMWKLALLLYPYCYQTFPESNKKTPNQNQINKNTEKSSSTIYLTLAGRNPLRRRWEASSTRLSFWVSLALSLSLALLLFSSRAAQKGLQSSLLNERQASSRDFSFLSLRAPDLIKGLCIR
jgi:hypothetical protein